MAVGKGHYLVPLQRLVSKALAVLRSQRTNCILRFSPCHSVMEKIPAADSLRTVLASNCKGGFEEYILENIGLIQSVNEGQN